MKNFNNLTSFATARTAALGSAIAFAIALAGCGGSGTKPVDGQPETPAATSLGAEQRNLQAIVAEVEASNSLHVAPDGTLVYQASSARAASLSSEAEEFAKATAQELNVLVKAGEVRISPDLYVKPTRPSQSSTSRLSFVGWRWWGGVFHFTHNDIQRGMAGFMTSLSLRPNANLIVSGPIYAMLNYVCNMTGHRGAYLHVTWILLWAASPNP